MKTLKEKEDYYTSSSSSYSNSDYMRSMNTHEFCRNGCGKLLIEKDGNPNLKECPFCKGTFCTTCKQLFPDNCKCKKEESKEEMEEEEVQKRE